jgi:hypothetical protein
MKWNDSSRFRSFYCRSVSVTFIMKQEQKDYSQEKFNKQQKFIYLETYVKFYETNFVLYEIVLRCSLKLKELLYTQK